MRQGPGRDGKDFPQIRKEGWHGEGDSPTLQGDCYCVGRSFILHFSCRKSSTRLHLRKGSGSSAINPLSICSCGQAKTGIAVLKWRQRTPKGKQKDAARLHTMRQYDTEPEFDLSFRGKRRFPRNDKSNSGTERLRQSLKWFAVGNLQRPTEIVAHLGARIDAESLEDGGEHIADGGFVALDVHAVFAGRAEDLAALDGAAAQHDRPAPRPVIAAGVLIDARRSAKLAHP